MQRRMNTKGDAMNNTGAQLVNTPSNGNAQPGIGHNRMSLNAAAQANVETGVLLLCKEALITAIQDKRLQRPHLRVMAAIATCINTRTAKAWPSRMAIAMMADLQPKSVSNVVRELRGWGYLISDRETVEEADGKRLTVYTFGNIDHEGIRREITKFVNQLRSQPRASNNESSRYDGNSEVPPMTGSSRPSGNFEFPPQGDSPAATGTKSSLHDGKFPLGRAQSSRYGGDSNSIKEQSLSHSQAAPLWMIAEDGGFEGQAFELSGDEFGQIKSAFGNLEFPAEMVSADAFLAGEFAKVDPPLSRDEQIRRLYLYLNNQNRKAGELRRQVVAAAASKPKSQAAPMIGENADRSKCWINEDGLHLSESFYAEWLKEFENNGERLDMAIKEIAPYVKPNSHTSLVVQVNGKLAKIIGEKLDKDSRYTKAAKPEKGISRLKAKFLRAGE